MDILLNNASVIHVERRKRELLSVLVSDGRITEISTRVDGTRPDTLIIDCDGSILIPGLIDCHVHLSLDASPGAVIALEQRTEVQIFLTALHNAQESLRYGVTTVRDLGSPRGVASRVRDALRRWHIPATEIISAGPAITSPGGHGHFLGVEVPAEPVRLRRAVDDIIDGGADWVKVMATGGLLTPSSNSDRPQFDRSCLTTIVDASARRHRKVAAHVLSHQGAEAALQAGVSSVEHGLGLDDDLLCRMKAQRVHLVPVLSPSDRQTRSPADTRVPEYLYDRISQVKPHLFKMCERAIKLGVPIATGTDAGVPLVPHGGVLHEVRLLITLGMPPFEALYAATLGAAQLLGLDVEVGSIATGKRADLVLLAGEHLEEVPDHPLLVLQAGLPVFSLLQPA